MKLFKLHQYYGEYKILPADEEYRGNIIAEGPCEYLSIIKLKAEIKLHLWGNPSTHVLETIAPKQRKLERLQLGYPEYSI